MRLILCDALRDLIPFVQFKTREKNHRRLLLLVMHGNIITGIPSFSVSKISFNFLMTPIDSTNDQNIVTMERSELTLLLVLYFQ